MKNKVLILNPSLAVEITYFAVLLFIASFAPLLGNQLLTGSLVNAALFFAAYYLGFQAAVLISLIPSIIALSIGLLPAVLAPMVPFIMVGNIILVTTFHCLKERIWIAAFLASLLKFAFLFTASFVVAEIISKEEIVSRVLTMMSWPQLFTALAGALFLIGYHFISSSRR